MIPSFSNDLIALSTDNGYLMMCNSDLTRIIHKYQANEREPCKHLAWYFLKYTIIIIPYLQCYNTSYKKKGC